MKLSVYPYSISNMLINYSSPDRSNILKLSLRTCLKYIREYDPLQYDDVTNVTDLLGFRLRVNAAESDVQANDDATTTSNDDGISELCSPKPVETPPLRKEDFCDTWLRSNSSIFLPVHRQSDLH